MVVYRLNNIASLLSLQEELNRIFEEIEKTFLEEESKWDRGYFYEPLMDAIEYDDKYVFFVELPGISLKDVELHLDGSSLIVSGENPFPVEGGGCEVFLRSECHYGPFRKIIRLEKPFYSENIDATLKDGILKIVVYKKV